jgi:periplasmic divalent cation tolerance protein
MTAMLMITTVGDAEQGEAIARELVGRRLAACVNMVPGMRSFYRWQAAGGPEKICDDGELLLLIKTMAAEVEEVTRTIRELHSYDLPEILAFEVSAGEPGFLEWIAASLGQHDE